MTMNKSSVILVTGGSGLVGKNLVAHLQQSGFTSVLSPDSTVCDLTNWESVEAFFKVSKPEYVFHMAGRVRGLGGHQNQQGVAYLKNTLINTYVVEASRIHKVKKILAMGTVAMYPDPLPGMPLKEEMLWMGVPHASEYGYAHAKRGMLAQLESYKKDSGMPFVLAVSTNLYGPHDRFDTETGHVIPSLVKKFYDAKKTGGEVVIWGDGTAQRDFLYISDAVRALVLMMGEADGVINLATGKTSGIKDAVSFLIDLAGMKDRVRWDSSKPNGQVLRAYDVSKLNALNFSCAYDLEKGLKETFDWFTTNVSRVREK